MVKYFKSKNSIVVETVYNFAIQIWKYSFWSQKLSR